MKPCPSCNSTKLLDRYVYVQCANCLMTGPQMNKGNFDQHCDFKDHEYALLAWDSLPRKEEK